MDPVSLDKKQANCRMAAVCLQGDGMEQLSIADIELILRSLEYTKRNIENYTEYPSYEFKQRQIQEVMQVIDKLRKMKKELK